MLESLAAHYTIDTSIPFEKLPATTTNIVLYGSGKEQIKFKYLNEKGTRFDRTHAFEGIIPSLERCYHETESAMVREELSKYLNNKPCPDCNGLRLCREARRVFVGGKTISDISRLSLINSRDFFNLLTLTGQKAQVGEKKDYEGRGLVPEYWPGGKIGKGKSSTYIPAEHLEWIDADQPGWQRFPAKRAATGFNASGGKHGNGMVETFNPLDPEEFDPTAPDK